MKKLNDDEVRLVKLDPMRVISAHGFGPAPESIAWQKVKDYARRHNLTDSAKRRFFGFNNPNPSPGSPNYGYEQWMTLKPGEEADDDLKVLNIPGGKYAVTRCTLSNIFDSWQALVAWVEDSTHRFSPRQCLEECLEPEILNQENPDWEQFSFDLYIAIR